MKRFKVFISSVQKEFSEERKEIVNYLTKDALLGGFFEPFIFEEVPANNNLPEKVFLNRVESSDIYIGLITKKRSERTFIFTIQWF